MSDFVKVTALADLPSGQAKAYEVQGKTIAIFNQGGQLYAVDNLCKHRGGPLAEGSVDGNVVTCPWHGWQFDITNGNCLTNPAGCTKSYPVKVESGSVFIHPN